ncbi:substrate-binding periplasmic protein [Pseudobacteriovorax antillogorgiicola]|uniref:Polar amino acid transport system substrate-binding protein n=1 Tax=Pseudobacteriovorax antillogorgiicola TaxID=1513793 RepID=A0A1Y6CFX2_9BACT|nr:transporter substrate-binding domain-containing protein [Pseudobacteriovorax antillogorgiicola]TCS48977.1 polar amino acid transport system substrate-binding protein [Pseudobacteriovorax antillogorgiicola]SMF53534.1 polar amino acid transport system substrate-binding protein [Pseudobacteriovorax antillogorgiicola]
MQAAIIIAIFCILSTPQKNVYAKEQGPISLVGEDLEDITQTDGKGLYWEVFEKIFLDAGFQIEKKIQPYARGQHLVQHKKVDGLIGAYKDEFDQAIFPKLHFDHDKVLALFRSGDFKNWQGQPSLSNKVVAWIRGYEYDAYLEIKDFTIKQLKNRSQAFQMLKRGRIDIFLDPKEDLNNELQKQIEKKMVKKDEFKTQLAITLNLYIAFQDTERGKNLASVYDQQIAKFVKNGKLKPLFEKWGVEYPH